MRCLELDPKDKWDLGRNEDIHGKAAKWRKVWLWE